MRRLLGGLLFLIASMAYGASYYVSTGGSGTTCSVGSPCSFVCITDRSCKAGIVGGDTIFLNDGVYVMPSGGIEVQQTGSVGNPVIIRPVHTWKDVTIDELSANPCSGGCLRFNHASYIRLMDITVDNTDTGTRQCTGACGVNPATRNDGVTVIGVPPGNGLGIELVNIVVKNVIDGILMNANGYGGLLYGSLLYLNGCYDPTARGCGHNLYVQNAPPDKPSQCLVPAYTRVVKANLMHHAMHIGVHHYTEGGRLDCVDFEHNTDWEDGFDIVAGYNATKRQDPYLSGANGTVGTSCSSSTKIAQLPIYNSNRSWDNASATAAAALNAGYSKGLCSPTITNNYFASAGESLHQVGWFGTATVTGNTFYGTPNPASLSTTYPSNTWASTFPTSGKNFFYEPNAYETGVGSATVYNWDLSATVNLDLAAMGAYSGETYELVSAEHPFASCPSTDCITGTWNSGTVSIKTSGFTPECALGLFGNGVNNCPAESGPQFVVYMLHVGSGSPSTPTPTNTQTPTQTPTNTPTQTPTQTFTPSPTTTATNTPTLTPTNTVTNTPTFTPSITPTPTPTPSVNTTTFTVSSSPCVVVAPMELVADATLPGGNYADTTVPNSGRITCSFNVPADGKYIVWAYVYGNTGTSDSFFESVNGDVTLPCTAPCGNHVFDVADSLQPCTDIGSGACHPDNFRGSNKYNWNRLNDRTATCGVCIGGGTVPGVERDLTLLVANNPQTLAFQGREVGARLVKFILTTDQSFDPNGNPTPTPVPGICQTYICCNHKCAMISIPCANVGIYKKASSDGTLAAPCPWK